jgi:hypothetical protein
VIGSRDCGGEIFAVPTSRDALSANPNGMQSFSLGLRGTSYPRGTNNEFINPERVESIPNISLVEFDFVALQKLAKFILKRNLRERLRHGTTMAKSGE